MMKTYKSNLVAKPLKDSGSALLALVFTLPFLILMAAFFISLTVSSFGLARGDQLRIHAQLATDGGIDQALKEINIDDTWSGTVGEVELQNIDGVKTTYEVVVTNVGSDIKLVTSTGRSYSPAGSSSPSKTVKVEVSLRPVGAGLTSIVTGVGGLYMSNSAKILGGDVKVNGEINMSNSAQIGLSTNSIQVDVANQNCPNSPDSNYPRVCTGGESTEPIKINNPAHIYGSVSANNQTTGDGMSNPGLIAGSGVSEEPLPTHDRAAQIAAVANTITGTAASCDSNSAPPQTWAENLKITGDVTLSKKCQVIVEGDVWITGKLELNNQAIMKVKDGGSITQPDIMVDGNPTSVVLNNSSEFASNSDDVGFRILTYWSQASCSPDCSSVSGIDLYNSRDTTTIIMNNFSQAAETVLYARWSRVEAGNAGAIGALVGQTVDMTNNSTVTFGTSAGGSEPKFWVIDQYRRDY